jgi:hypothetical protein
MTTKPAKNTKADLNPAALVLLLVIAAMILCPAG